MEHAYTEDVEYTEVVQDLRALNLNTRVMPVELDPEYNPNPYDAGSPICIETTPRVGRFPYQENILYCREVLEWEEAYPWYRPIDPCAEFQSIECEICWGQFVPDQDQIYNYAGDFLVCGYCLQQSQEDGTYTPVPPHRHRRRRSEVPTGSPPWVDPLYHERSTLLRAEYHSKLEPKA